MRSLRAYDEPLHDEVFDAQRAPSEVGVDPVIDVSDLVRDEVPDASTAAPRRNRSRTKERLAPMEPRAPMPVSPAPVVSEVVSMCLACGAPPDEEGECRHDEVAHLQAASAVVLAAVQRLRAALQEARAQERALRRLVGVEVSSGRGSLESARTPAALSPTPREGPCATCGHRSTSLRRARRQVLIDAQQSFLFEAPDGLTR
jgi:hypothetical protein